MRLDLLIDGLLQKHFVFGPGEPLEPRIADKIDDKDSKDDNQHSDPVDKEALSWFCGIIRIFAKINNKKNSATFNKIEHL